MNFLLALAVGALILGSFWLASGLTRTRAAVGEAEAEAPAWFRNAAPLCSALASAGALMETLFTDASKAIADRLAVAGLGDRLTVAQVWAASLLYAPLFGAMLAGMGLLLDVTAGKEDGILWLFGLVPGLLMGLSYPSGQLRKSVEARQRAISRALPFVFDLLHAAVSAGQSFGAAVQSYLDLRLPNPLTEEFAQMMREQQVSSRDVALRGMAGRIRLDAFTYFAEAVINSDKTGATLSETIRIQAEEMRKARFNLAERLAAKAPTKILFPMILFIMPAVFVVIGAPVAIRIMDLMREMH